MKKLVYLISCLVLSGISSAQFSTPSGDYTINSAKLNPTEKGFANRVAAAPGVDEFQLTIPSPTNDILWQDAAVWHNTKINLANSFKIEAQMLFGDKNFPGYSVGAHDPGGDGIKFVLQPISNERLTLQGGGTLGWWQLNNMPPNMPSFDVEFDTFENEPMPGCDGADPYGAIFGGPKDIPEDHIAFARDGSYCHNLKHPQVLIPNVSGGVNEAGQVEDGEWHDVILVWNAVTKRFEVTFDGTSYFIDVDLNAFIFGGVSEVFWGFTAGTNWATNDQRVRILNIETTPPSVSIVEKNNISCFGLNNGSVSFNVTGGVAPYTYTFNLMSGDITTLPITFENLSPGNYVFRVTDATGQQDDISVIITSPTLLTATVSTSNVDCLANTGGSVTITPSGGTKDYTLTGTGIPSPGMTISSGFFVINDLSEGTYSYTITDNNGCTVGKTVTIIKNCNEKCFESPTIPGIVNAKSIWSFDVSGNVVIRTTLAKSFVDNTYGNQTIMWPGGGGYGNHSFNHLVTSDNLQLALYDAAGIRRMEFRMDYISKVGSVYKSTGVTGNDGTMLFGSASNVIKVTTSLEKNLGLYPSYTTNSPATDNNYSPNPAALLWDYNVWYEVTVKPTAFPGGFGFPRFTGVHASPSKTGKDTEIVVDAECPGDLSIGNLVWKDENDNGIFDAGEEGLPGLTVKLYKGGVAIKSTTTSSSGAYSFDELQAGNYVVGVLVPENYFQAANPVATPTGNIDNDNNGAVVVGNEIRTNILALAANDMTIDIALKYVAPPCNVTTPGVETFPTSYNATLTKSLSNKTFSGATGTWTANSDAKGSIAVINPGLAGSSTALSVNTYATDKKTTGFASALSPVVNVAARCCPAETELSFQLWKKVLVSGDSKATIKLEFSGNNGSSWTTVWTKTSGQLFAELGAANNKSYAVSLDPSVQTNNFRYRFSADMQKSNSNNFNVFIDEVTIGSPASCTGMRTTQSTSATNETAVAPLKEITNEVVDQLTVTVMPNPTRSEFTLKLQAKDEQPARVRLIDESGRMLRTFSNLPSNHTLRFGKELKKGTYFAEVIQGVERKIIKLVKM